MHRAHTRRQCHKTIKTERQHVAPYLECLARCAESNARGDAVPSFIRAAAAHVRVRALVTRGGAAGSRGVAHRARNKHCPPPTDCCAACGARCPLEERPRARRARRRRTTRRCRASPTPPRARRTPIMRAAQAARPHCAQASPTDLLGPCGGWAAACAQRAGRRRPAAPAVGCLGGAEGRGERPQRRRRQTSSISLHAAFHARNNGFCRVRNGPRVAPQTAGTFATFRGAGRRGMLCG